MNIQKRLPSLLTLIALGLILTLTACTRKYAFQSSTSQPAARGTVKVKQDGNKNYVIKIDIRNLAEVKRLEPSRDAYIVWMVGADDVTKNIGQIKSSSTMISSKLKASFETVSSNKPHRIFVTAENDATVTSPGSMVVLSTDSF
jgi:hypothetical protein